MKYLIVSVLVIAVVLGINYLTDTPLQAERPIAWIPQEVIEDEMPPIDLPAIDEAVAEVNRNGWHTGCAKIEDQIKKWIDMPPEPERVYLLAGCLQEIYQEEHVAIELLEAALAVDPTQYHLTHMLGNAYFRVGDDLKAEELLEELLADPEADQWQRGHGGAVRSILAASKVRMAGGEDIERLREARSLLDEASQIEGLQNISPVRHGQLAQVSLAMGNFDEAILEASLAVELVEQSTVWDAEMKSAMKAENLMTWGQALYLQGDVEEGNARMDEAIAVSPPTLQPVMSEIKRSMSEPVIIEQDPDSNISMAVPLEPHEYKEWTDE